MATHWGILGGGAALLIALVVAITLAFEPNFAASIAGEAKSPWVISEWLRILRAARRDRARTPAHPRHRVLALDRAQGAATEEVRWAVLAIVLLGSSLVLSAKYGADLNYFVSLRVPKSLAIGTLWHAGRTARGSRRSTGLSAAAVMAIAALAPGTLNATTQAASAWRERAPFIAEPREVLPALLPEGDPPGTRPGLHLLTDRDCSTSTRVSGRRSATPCSSGCSSTRARSNRP